MILDASGNSGITDAGLKHVPGLMILHASGNRGITDAGLKHVPELTTLFVRGNGRITHAGRRLMRQRQVLKFLQTKQPIFRAGLLTIAHELDSAEPVLVYADWLEERGDSRAFQLRAALLTTRHRVRKDWQNRLAKMCLMALRVMHEMKVPEVRLGTHRYRAVEDDRRQLLPDAGR
jgi:uncharacterized protein (TIGR02996 family)